MNWDMIQAFIMAIVAITPAVQAGWKRHKRKRASKRTIRKTAVLRGPWD